jgi:thiol-disulfide isomerase/thioredoxin
MAPDIEARDLDGTSFKLSDYRGRVTVLVFWASWCGPCMAMVPDERKLVDRMKNQPFVLIGVNGDPRLNDAKRVVAEKSMVWRSFWNGTNGPAGPISRAWNVRGWPTVYILDGKGVIR